MAAMQNIATKTNDLEDRDVSAARVHCVYLEWLVETVGPRKST
jgi:hypothetical protein